MPILNFWVDNNYARLNEMKALIKTNPQITHKELAQHFNKTISSIRRVRHRYKLLNKNKINRWSNNVIDYVISKKNEGLTYIEIVPLLKQYFNIIVTGKRLGQVMSENGATSKIKKPTLISDTKHPIITTDGLQPIQWKISTTKVKPSKKSKLFKTYLVTADYHVPYFNVFAVKSILHLMDDVKFDGFILLGDYMDMAPISHWLQDRKKNRSLEGKRMQNDYIEGNKLLDEFDKRLSKDCDKRYFYGNHERFYFDLIDKMPALEDLLNPKIELKLKERGYITYDTINHIERIGRLALTHGMYHSQNYVKKHIDEFKTNVMHADIHSPRFRLEPSPAKEIAIAGYCVGCLCDMNPEYMQNRAHKWAHGFAVIYIFDNGFFHVDLKRIVRGSFIYNNKLYNGNK